MTSAQVARLKAAFKRIQNANFAKDRGTAIAEAERLIDEIVASQPRTESAMLVLYRKTAVRLLDAVGAGSLFPDARHHIKYNRGSEFSAAIEELQGLVGRSKRSNWGTELRFLVISAPKSLA